METASHAVHELAARWTPDALARLLSVSLTLAGLEGREAVFAEAGEKTFAEDPADLDRLEFPQQIEFLRQKRGKPTRAWTDAMAGDHDRSFVVAGVTDMAMLEEFQAAIIEGAQTYDIEAFAGEFDRLVEKYGWSYNGGREWRIRTIFETNIRTSYMAGRLAQMRDPEMVKRRPYWQYLHADSRVPLNPRPHHLAWDGLVLRWDDPWWDHHFPPNDWACSCGMRTLSERDLKRLGKTGPDTAPEIRLRPHTHKASGQTVMLPEGIGFGWDHMPGDLWERGLVPSRLLDEAGGQLSAGRHLVRIDEPEPLADLLADARPFSLSAMQAVDHLKGLADPSPEEFVRAFLNPFGARPGQAALFTDVSGFRIPISDQLFRDRAGDWKVAKRGREEHLPLLAEALRDPDEIWLGLVEKEGELVVDRRYIRAAPDLGLLVVFEMGRRWWEGITGYQTTKKGGKRPDLGLLDRRRGGKLIWKRKRPG